MQESKLVISSDGDILSIYSDDLAELMEQGDATVQRASHVEYDNQVGGWTADMAPVGGPVLSAYRERKVALDVEVHWLNEHLHEIELKK